MSTWIPGLSRARGAFVLAIGFVVLLSSAIWLYWTVEGATNYQRDVRLAQGARDAVFRAQIDQETSMRGFTSTLQANFLVPYGRSQATIDAAFGELEDRLRRLRAVQLLRFVDDEVAIHKRWHDEVAAPLLIRPRGIEATRLQYRGKALMDDFRGRG